MDLKAKLARLSIPSSSKPTPPTEDKWTRISRLRGLLADMAQRTAPLRHRPDPDLRAPLPGELRQTPYGPLQIVEQWSEPRRCHGRVPLAGALSVDPRHVAALALDPSLAEVDLRGILFVDTETTGLAGGAGTLAFLIGLAWFEDESLRVQQLVLRRPGEEAAMLRHLADRLAAASCLCTYNGKTFDWPLLRTRFVLNRIPIPVPAAHLDLLHCMRRIFRRRLGDVSLQHVEVELLGARRERDISGAEIPGLYLDYLRGADGSSLTPVIEHNGNDLLALAAMLSHVGPRFAAPRRDDDPRDHLGFARVAARADDPDRALAFARAAASGGGQGAVTADACELACRLLRRRGDPAEAARVIESGLAAVCPGTVAAARLHLTLAKLCEHRLRDPRRALKHANLAADVEEPAAHTRRCARLEARAQRISKPSRTRRRSGSSSQPGIPQIAITATTSPSR